MYCQFLLSAILTHTIGSALEIHLPPVTYVGNGATAEIKCQYTPPDQIVRLVWHKQPVGGLKTKLAIIDGLGSDNAIIDDSYNGDFVMSINANGSLVLENVQPQIEKELKKIFCSIETEHGVVEKFTTFNVVVLPGTVPIASLDSVGYNPGENIPIGTPDSRN